MRRLKYIKCLLNNGQRLTTFHLLCNGKASISCDSMGKEIITLAVYAYISGYIFVAFDIIIVIEQL